MRSLSLGSVRCSTPCSPIKGGSEAPSLPIRVPDGFVVETAAAPPLVQYLMMAGFDERERAALPLMVYWPAALQAKSPLFSKERVAAQVAVAVEVEVST
jgi:hypothetical protein